MDLGSPSSYRALLVGTPVYSSDEQPVGKVAHVLAVESEDVFDGIVLADTPFGEGHRFADADEVAHIYDDGVVLRLTRVEAEQLPEPSANPAVLRDDPGESKSEIRHEKLKRAWAKITGDY